MYATNRTSTRGLNVSIYQPMCEFWNKWADANLHYPVSRENSENIAGSKRLFLKSVENIDREGSDKLTGLFL